MSPNPEGPIELAMTHIPFAGGVRACHRPDPVILTARRVAKWKDDPQVCQSCSSHDARFLRAGVALCPSCRENRAVGEADIDYLDRRVAAVRAEPTTGTGLEGYAITFNQWSVDLGGFVERIRPHAVNRTIDERIDLRALWNHNSDVTLGRISANTLTVRKDATGLFMRVVPPSWAGNYIESVERRDITGQSFGFRVLDDEWDFDAKVPQRDVLDMRISEVSSVSFPAYPSTTLRVVQNVTLEGQRSKAYYDSKLRLAR